MTQQEQVPVTLEEGSIYIPATERGWVGGAELPVGEEEMSVLVCEPCDVAKNHRPSLGRDSGQEID